MAFKKAIKSQAKLRAALFGPAGAGKTFSALSIAAGMGGKVALIDSERGSASKYADRFEFDTVDLEKKNIDEYISFISEAGGAGYNVLIIDSLSHAWAELLEQIDKLANAKYKGNTWSAWSEGTPKQRKLIDAILSSPCHIIATMRSKTEWTTSTDNGKSRPVRVGLAPEQGKGIEYEFDLLLEISPEHLANVIKDRTGKYQDQVIDKPGAAFGKDLVAWLSSGVATQPAPKPEAAVDYKAERKAMLEQIGAIITGELFSDTDRAEARELVGTAKPDADGVALLRDLLQTMKKQQAEREKAVGSEKPFEDDIPWPADEAKPAPDPRAAAVLGQAAANEGALF